MHDFQRYILDIEANSSLSLRGIARKLGCHVATISDIKQGRTKEPKAILGMAIIRMHKRAMKNRA
jgi:hypothetical protein